NLSPSVHARRYVASLCGGWRLLRGDAACANACTACLARASLRDAAADIAADADAGRTWARANIARATGRTVAAPARRWDRDAIAPPALCATAGAARGSVRTTAGNSTRDTRASAVRVPERRVASVVGIVEARRAGCAERTDDSGGAARSAR